jgi:hypothetical protein
MGPQRSDGAQDGPGQPSTNRGGGPTILAQEADSFPRTVERADCQCKAEFGLEFKLHDEVLAAVLFAATGGEATVMGSQTVGVQVKIISVGPFPGSLSFAFTRDAPNAARIAAPGPFAANSLDALKAELKGVKYSPLAAPPRLSRTQTPIVETVTATATWAPQNGTPCTLTDQVRLVWQYAVNRNDNTPPSYAVAAFKGTNKTGVTAGKTLSQPPKGRPNDPPKPYGVPLYVFYSIKDTTHCCGVERDFAVIQFVRHLWELNETPQKKGNDEWALDVLSSQVHAADQHQPYDPTFTHNPLGSAPNEPPIVYPGPNVDGSSAIVQIDLPGLPPELYARFRAAGGTFTWEFYGFLVCQLNPSDMKKYIEDGTVVMSLYYAVKATFPGGGGAPTVADGIIEGPTERHCEKLKDVIAKVDRSLSLHGDHTLQHAYDHPREHQIRLR